MVGQNIGKYRVLDRVGRGGMGTVYRALDETLHRDVAIKVLNAELNDPEVARRFRAEAITVARLSHPGIATIYELFQHDGQWLMVMEFVQGETLERMIERGGALAPEHAAELCMQSLAALAHAHSMGVVHRDLKPANIMLTEGGTIKIMDFGIARVAGTEHLTNAGFMMGTPAYMAPEQVLGQEIDARADLYAMGVVFYRLLSAHLPFKGDTPFSMAQAQVNNPPTPVGTYCQGLPPWVDEIMARSLAKKPDDRFQSAVAFHEGFAHSLAGQPMTSVYHSSAPTGLMMTPPRAVPTGTLERTVISTTPPSTPRAGQTVPDLTIAPAVGIAGMDVGPTMAVATPRALERPPTGAWPETEVTPVIQPRPGHTSTPVAVGGPVVSMPAIHAPAPPPAHTASRAGVRGRLVGIAAALVVLLGVIAFFVWPRGGPPEVTPDPAQIAASESATAPPVTPDPVPVAPAPQPVARPVTRPAAPLPTAGVGPDGTMIGESGPAGAVGPSAATGDITAAGRGAAGAGRRVVPVIDVNQEFDDVKVMIVDGRKANDEDVRLNFVPAQLTIVGERAGNAIANVPYRDVANMTYTRGRDPKWNADFSSPPDDLDVGGILRTPKHWLILQTRDSFVLFRLEDSNWTRVLQTVEARTGLPVNRPTSNDKN